MALDDEVGGSPQVSRSKRRQHASGSDTDFAAAGESDGDDYSEAEGSVDPRELQQKERSGKGMNVKNNVQSRQPPQKQVKNVVKQKASVTKKRRRSQASSTVEQRRSASKKTNQSGHSSKRQQTSGPKPTGLVKPQATPVKVAGSSLKKPNSSGKKPRIPPKNVNVSGKRVDVESTTNPPRMQKPSKKQENVVKKQVLPAATSGSLTKKADGTGKTQAVSAAGPSTGSKVSQSSINAHESDTKLVQHKANRLHSQNTSQTLKLPESSHLQPSNTHQACINPPMQESTAHSQIKDC